MKYLSHFLYIFSVILFLPLAACTHSDMSQDKIKKSDDFRGRKIVVVTGTSEDVYARKHFQSSTILQTSSTSDLVLNVKTGKAEIGLINYNVVQMFMMKYPDLGIINDSLYGNPIGVGFSKSRTDLRDRFNAFLKQMKASGQYEEVRKRWIDHFKEAKMPVIKNDGKNGVITLQTEGEKAPFSFIRDGRLSGLDIEIAERFAASQRMSLNVKLSNFGGVIEAVSTGSADMAIDCIFITPERAKKILFSDPYFICNACAFGMKDHIEGCGDDNEEHVGFWAGVKSSFVQNFIEEKRYEMVGKGLLCTIEITLFAAVFGTIIGVLICFMRMQKRKCWQKVANFYIHLFRGIPQVVLLMILFYVIFSSSGLDGVTVSVIGFSLVFAAYVSEMFRTTVESVNYGQVEAGLSMGFSHFQSFYYIVLPLTIRRVLPIYKGEFIGLLKSTSIVGYITVQDLTKMSDLIRSTTFDAFMPLLLITVIYFVIIWLFSFLLDRIQLCYKPREEIF